MNWSIQNSWLWILVSAVVLFAATILIRRKMHRGTDIRWPEFPDNLVWANPAAVEESLGAIYRYSAAFSAASIAWYQSRRRPKRIAGFLLRVSALVATFIAGLVPLSTDVGLPAIPAAVSTVLLALAGLFVSIDGLGGFTSGWVRYMLAQQKIERASDAFHMEWNGMMMAAGDRQAMLDKAKLFLLSIGKIVDDETQEWATEFQNALKELERVRKAEADTPRTGALEITVKTPPAGGWIAEIDGTQRGATTGRKLAINDVPLGQRKIRASGKDAAGKLLTDEAIVKIEGGMTAQPVLDLT